MFVFPRLIEGLKLSRILYKTGLPTLSIYLFVTCNKDSNYDEQKFVKEVIKTFLPEKITNSLMLVLVS